MKRITLILLSLVMTLSTWAQESPVFERTPAQQGVKISSDVILIAMPVATLTGMLIAQDWTGLKQAAFTTATTLGATYLLKYTVKKQRPDFSDFHSFPSGHTSVTFANAAFVQRRYGWKFGIPAYALAAYVGWARTYAKKHDWWDVLAGAAIGAGSAYIFTRPFAKKHDLSIAPVSDGHNFGIVASIKF